MKSRPATRVPARWAVAAKGVVDGLALSVIGKAGRGLPVVRVGCLVIALTVPRVGWASTPPWARSEARGPCSNYSTVRLPLFGDLHIHTRYSADAYIFGTRVDPRGAYAFARGTAAVTLADENEAQTRSAAIDRPLDFAAVTDHAEFFGETYICAVPGTPGNANAMCDLIRQAEHPDDQFLTTVRWLFPAGVPNPPSSHAFCSEPGIDCDAAAVSAWLDMQAAAEEAYDRTPACTFTSFIGYEHTPSPIGRHLHRNVIFRNASVPAFPKSHLETHAAGVPQGLWNAVEVDCLDASAGCDAVIIPHNPNLSGGLQWLDPADAAEAARRQRLEPLAEMHQQKGNSECRYDRLAGAGTATEDELCVFEQEPLPDETPGTVVPPVAAYPRRNLVRNTLKDGLALEARLGVNPFQFGFVGSTDTHNATAGNTAERAWPGGEGNHDASPAFQIRNNVRTNPGGLAVVWAEENSRDAIFAALRRRETYATSGTRPVLRFFAGDYPGLDCGAADLAERGYASGTPMGGEIGAVRGRKSPDFVISAIKDPGTATSPGTDLAGVQVVKGWVDADGETHERVIDVAGKVVNGADVDPVTCEPRGAGATELCAVWHDPAFDPDERAFYYARVLENPTCRWSTRVCQAAGVDPFSPQCGAQAAVAGEAFADCCLAAANDPFLAPTIQERAWSSPIWYRPDGIGRLAGRITRAARQNHGALSLRATMARLPAGFDVATSDLTVTVEDNDEVARISIAGRHWQRRGRDHFVYEARFGAQSRTDRAVFIRRRGGGRLRLRAKGIDVSRADRADHMVTVTIAAGSARATHTRLWRRTARGLAIGAR